MDVFLQPGDYFVGDAEFRVRTILGSCVSITLWHPRRREGAMSHFLLASRPRHGNAPLDGRYGAEVVQLMLQELEQKGIRVRECEAKIFGGGNMFPGRRHPHVGDIGRRNGEAARKLLRQRGISVRSEHLFGSGHRQVIFNIATGDVWVRQVSPLAPARATM
ncbi:chemotaxis protein CheD [Bordetella genomosp. 10]|uniref:Probable chemoreceptor glutamine deamidase CheD n=1 Tax=Bordetella genomosp. 10 TaxID=1416804 RepID=A0A261S6T5_9BORD|nr:chemotaxis protein CheD [Bordetella genomosp. 10]